MLALYNAHLDFTVATAKATHSKSRGPTLVEILYALAEITGWKSEIKQALLLVIYNKDMYIPRN